MLLPSRYFFIIIFLIYIFLLFYFFTLTVLISDIQTPLKC